MLHYIYKLTGPRLSSITIFVLANSNWPVCLWLMAIENFLQIYCANPHAEFKDHSLKNH